MTEKNPAVSIIMPMYNVEKYIGDCLDSLVEQTFKDFEVIVVDDCSTDRSCEIAESYALKLNLTLIRSEKNSGSPGIARNKGIDIAKGKYLYLVDSDDAITETALGELYNLAEEFQADVVHCEKYFPVQDENFTTDKSKLTATAYLKADFVTEPTLMSENVEERIKQFISGKFDWTTCNQFMRLDFINSNGLRIPTLRASVDCLFGIYLLCLAESILCVPNAVYIYRRRQGSITETDSLSATKKVQRYGDLFLRGFAMLDKFFNNQETFIKNPMNKFLVYDFLINFLMSIINGAYEQAPLHELDETVREEVKKIEDTIAITAFYFDYVNILRLNLNKYQKEIQSLNEENDKLRKISMKMIEVANYRRVETQNLKSVLDNAAVEEVIKFG